MSLPTVQGRAVEGSPYREAQVCLGRVFANSTYRFFLSGTSTPANVYQNGTLTNAFPITGLVTADNFGRFPAIYLDPSVTYRVQFFNAANVQQWQVDPYISQLSTVGTSSLSAFGFQIAPTGEFILDAPNSGGSNITLTMKSGSLGTSALRVTGTLPGNSALIVNSSVTTGAQTATFAAANKPGTATSSPAGWLPITCDGVQYYTPIWHGNNFTPYVSNPTALGEVIVASSVTFNGNGLTTVVGGTATPSNWFTPTAVGIGAGFWINITKTGGLSGLAFSSAQGAWVNISAGGLTINSNAQAPITGTYQLSTSSSGSPVVANGTISLSNNNGVQSPTYNGAVPLVLAGNGTATLNGGATSNWFAPTTPNTGSGFWINITQTGGSPGATFSAAAGAWTNITNGGLTVGISGGSGAVNVTGTYIIASDAGGVNQFGSGSVTLTSGSNVQSPNWSGTTPLKLNGNGSATLNGSATFDWSTPNAANIGAGFWINITRTSGTAGVNFSAAQGSWTNITNSGLTIDMTGFTGDVGTVSVGGTYQISSSNTGMPVLGSGSVSLSVNAGTVIRTYTTGTGATEIVPTGATNVVIECWGAPGGGSGGSSGSNTGTGGASGGYSRSSYACSGGQTILYTAGVGGTGGSSGGGNGGPGSASHVNSGTLAITTLNGGGGGGGNNAVGDTGGTASGGNVANTPGNSNAALTRPGAAAVAGVNAAGSDGGQGGSITGTAGSAGGPGVICFKYT